MTAREVEGRSGQRADEGGMFLPPGGGVDLRHCGVPMAHQISAMQWTVNRFEGWRPGPGRSRHAFACQRCEAKALVDLETPDAVWTFQQRERQLPGDEGRSRKMAARRASIAEWDRRVREQVAAAPDAHAMAIADAVLAALEEAG
ncbi:hypothetical protein [Nonomuraea recticatena]|uniref:Uncharacterized protein n=1 Tax=Nonomuraea recticatena TaxID=46178 RepID=A0ABP6FAX1_9ACTN